MLTCGSSSSAQEQFFSSELPGESLRKLERSLVAALDGISHAAAHVAQPAAEALIVQVSALEGLGLSQADFAALGVETSATTKVRDAASELEKNAARLFRAIAEARANYVRLCQFLAERRSRAVDEGGGDARPARLAPKDFAPLVQFAREELTSPALSAALASTREAAAKLAEAADPLAAALGAALVPQLHAHTLATLSGARPGETVTVAPAPGGGETVLLAAAYEAEASCSGEGAEVPAWDVIVAEVTSDTAAYRGGRLARHSVLAVAPYDAERCALIAQHSAIATEAAGDLVLAELGEAPEFTWPSCALKSLDASHVPPLTEESVRKRSLESPCSLRVNAARSLAFVATSSSLTGMMIDMENDPDSEDEEEDEDDAEPGDSPAQNEMSGDESPAATGVDQHDSATPGSSTPACPSPGTPPGARSVPQPGLPPSVTERRGSSARFERHRAAVDTSEDRTARVLFPDDEDV